MSRAISALRPVNLSLRNNSKADSTSREEKSSIVKPHELFPAPDLAVTLSPSDGERAGVRGIFANRAARATEFNRAPLHSGQTSRSCAQLHQLSSIESAFAPRSTS